MSKPNQQPEKPDTDPERLARALQLDAQIRHYLDNKRKYVAQRGTNRTQKP